MPIFKVVCGEIVAGYGGIEECESLVEWLESEGANGDALQIVPAD